jgi:hypothetical protein
MTRKESDAFANRLASIQDPGVLEWLMQQLRPKVILEQAHTKAANARHALHADPVKTREDARRRGKKYVAKHRDEINARSREKGNTPAKRESSRSWKKRNRERELAYKKKRYAEAVAEDEARVRDRQRKERDAVRANFPERSAQYARAWRTRHQDNPKVIVERRLRARFGVLMRDGVAHKLAPTLALVGCSPEFLRAHLEALFQPGMNWANRSEWHIDHIQPCSAFDLTVLEEQQKCFHFTNLQPLWKRDNLSKGGVRRLVRSAA